MTTEEQSVPQVMHGQECPMCKSKTLTLMEDERDIPFFGKCALFSMTCSSCKYHKADVEILEKHEASKYTFNIENEEDLKVRVIRSAEGKIKIPHMITLESGETANGFITNVEGILNRMKNIIEFARDNEEDKSLKKKAKNQLKKINKALWGQESLKLIIEDPTGNSAIVSDKAEKKKL